MLYKLDDFNAIASLGFNCELSEKTILRITNLATQVGSPTYIKTPIFTKGRTHEDVSPHKNKAKRRGNVEASEEDWESLRSFQETKIERRTGVLGIIDQVRSHLNKMTTKNYKEMYGQITDILMMDDKEAFRQVAKAVFEVASANRFYSQLYAQLYTDLIRDFEFMLSIFHDSLDSYNVLFENIRYVDPQKDYDMFCEINAENEKRKSLSMFFVNLSLLGVIPKSKIIDIAKHLLTTLLSLITLDEKKNEVDEIAENIAILFNKAAFSESELEIGGVQLLKVVENIAEAKPKAYKSLTSKTVFKFMDIIGK